VPPPTYASHLNRIEAHLWAISEFVANNADYDSWEQFGLAMAPSHQLPQRPPPKPPPRRPRAAEENRPSDAVSSGTFRDGPLAAAE
jgi:hypothetical protein